jgi:hypothetical protein
MDILLSGEGLPIGAPDAPDAWEPVTVAEFVEAIFTDAYHDAMVEADVQAMAEARAAWEVEDEEAEDDEEMHTEEAQDVYYKPSYSNPEWGTQLDGDADYSETADDREKPVSPPPPNTTCK